VINPYADKVQLPREAHKIRRLNDLYQSFVKQVTLINQYRRSKDNRNRLISQKEDLQTAADIMFESILLKVDELDGSLRLFYENLKDYVEATGKDHHETYSFSQREIRQALNISKTQLQRYLRNLASLEYIQLSGGHINRGFKYKISYWDNIDKLRAKVKRHLQGQLDQLELIRLFYDYLEQTGIIHENPTTLIRFPKAKYKERTILTREEIKQLYIAADTMKEKAFLALFYGCGLRRSEAEKLNMHDIDMESGFLYVREGKGKKRRAVPMSEKVKADLGNYINLERRYEIKLHHEASLMINGRGTRMTKSTYYKFFGKLLVKAEIHKSISIHNLRHTIATHLLESGLEIEQVRSFLGHAELETTQIYTRVSWKN
jgi:site-specific recombinase XerD